MVEVDGVVLGCVNRMEVRSVHSNVDRGGDKMG